MHTLRKNINAIGMLLGPTDKETRENGAQITYNIVCKNIYFMVDSPAQFTFHLHLHVLFGFIRYLILF